MSDDDETLMQQLRAPQQPSEPTPRPSRRGRQFTKFPEIWGKRLLDACAGGAAWRLALVLLRRVDWENPVIVTNPAAATAHVDRLHKRRVLEKLQRLGLIEVEWRGRKSPRVKILR